MQPPMGGCTAAITGTRVLLFERRQNPKDRNCRLEKPCGDFRKLFFKF